jgi:serine/threonine protein kinase
MGAERAAVSRPGIEPGRPFGSRGGRLLVLLGERANVACLVYNYSINKASRKGEMADLVGKNIGRYHVVEQLGQGGMATVFKAYDTRLERDVAIKVIRTGAITPDMLPELLKRFEREAKALAKFTHPNIVPIIDYGEYEGAPYLVMAYLPGGTLKEITGKVMGYRQAARLLLPIARALEFAHKRNVIHRDVKPANILITEEGEPMLSDFGIAKILEADQATQLTGTGVGIGTPEYMAPEQWRGKTVPGTDIYALGIIFYELVTGRKPYTADTPAAVAIMQAMDPLPRPREFVPELPDEIEKVLFKALSKQPEGRFENMEQFAQALEKLVMGETFVWEEPVPESELETLVTPSAILRSGEIPSVDRQETGRKKRSFPPLFVGGLSGLLLLVVVLIVLLVTGIIDTEKFEPAVIDGVSGQVIATESVDPAAPQPSETVIKTNELVAMTPGYDNAPTSDQDQMEIGTATPTTTMSSTIETVPTVTKTNIPTPRDVSPVEFEQMITGANVYFSETFESPSMPDWSKEGTITDFTLEDGILTLSVPKENGKYWVLARNQKFSQGEAILTLIQFDANTGVELEAFSYLGSVSSTRSWGINHNPAFSSFQTSGRYESNWIGGENLSGALIPKANVWYYMFMTPLGPQTYYVRVWTEFNQEMYAEKYIYKNEEWKDRNWEFHLLVNYGTVRIKEYREMMLDNTIFFEAP